MYRGLGLIYIGVELNESRSRGFTGRGEDMKTHHPIHTGSYLMSSFSVTRTVSFNLYNENVEHV